MEKIKLGVIGLGQRGSGLLKEAIVHQADVAVTAVCDIYSDRVDEMASFIKERQGLPTQGFQDWRELLCSGVDAVVVATSWDTHTDIAMEAMRLGIAVGCEVGGAYSIDECHELIRAQEKSGTPFMFLENCCYGRNEMMLSNMLSDGFFGKLSHCQGGYRHDLRDEVACGAQNRHYRLEQYKRRCCDNYPTHALGPIARFLKLNQGNRMVSLVSVASAAFGLNSRIRAEWPDSELADYPFSQGDVVTTIIKCAGGETVTLTLDTTLPRYYSRNLSLHGTKGSYNEDNQSVFLDGTDDFKHDFDWTPKWNNLEEYREKYEHDLWRAHLLNGAPGGHGGMDWLMLRDFLDCIHSRRPMPITVYDAASWMCISALTEMSISMGGSPVPVPDFTKGAWMHENSKSCGS